MTLIDPKQITEEQATVYEQLCYAEPFVAEFYGKNHPLVIALAEHLHQMWPGGEFSFDPAEITKLHKHIFTIEEEELRKVFNGWSPSKWWPTKSGFHKAEAFYVDGPQPFLCVATKREQDPDHDSYSDFITTDGFESVRVMIHEGTKKADALRDLIKLMGIIERDWDKLVTESETEWTEDIGGAVEAAIAANKKAEVEEADAEDRGTAQERWTERLRSVLDINVPVFEAEDEAADTAVFEPHLTEWDAEVPLIPLAETEWNAWEIFDHSRPIATIVIGPHFTRDEGRDIAHMMYSAPFLWRLLREVGSEIHEWGHGSVPLLVGKIADELRQAVTADTQVYLPRTWDKEAEADAVERMETVAAQVVRTLADEQKGGAV